MIRALSKSFSDKTIIIRPHPMEVKEFYKNEFKEYENIKVIHDGSSKEWIVDADTVIHHDCTTGIEAFIAKKKVVSFSPYNNKDHVIKLPQDVSIKFDKIEDLINFLKKGNRQDPSDLEDKYIKLLKLTNNINNKNKKAVDVIVLNLVKLCQGINNKKPMLLKQLYYLGKIRILNFVERVIYRKKKSLSNMRKEKFPYLIRQELDERLNIWKELLSVQKITVKELEKDTFLLKK